MVSFYNNVRHGLLEIYSGMSNKFYIRVWVQGDEVPFINSNELPIDRDIVDIPNSIVWDADVSGEYMNAGEVRDSLSVYENGLTVSGRQLSNMKKSTR